MPQYDTLSEAVNGLKDRGFNLDFNLEANCIICQIDKFDPHDFEIVEFHRFEGNSDPADESIVYAIQSKTGLKGILVNGYGISADAMSSDMVKKLQLERHWNTPFL